VVIAVSGAGEDAILQRFPAPPGSVVHAIDQLAIVRRGDPEEIAAAGDLFDLPRPWDPATCPSRLREAVWEWCDAVADWINHDYSWRPAQMIPACWPRHSHIARELPILACQRWAAEQALGYELIDDWHRYTLPLFLERMIARLGESTCRTGKHADWPAESRHATYRGRAAVEDRQSVIHLDAHRITELRAAGRR
jgi:hypothetical protein